MSVQTLTSDRKWTLLSISSTSSKRTGPFSIYILHWIGTQKGNHGLRITGYHEVRLPYISGNEEDPQQWQRVYDFSRTVHVTLRYLMLTVAGILHFHDPGLSEPSKTRNRDSMVVTVDPRLNREINHNNHLAQNVYEAQWVSAHFDMLFPHFHIENLLNGIGVGERRYIPSNELVIVDTTHRVVWNVIVSLSVTSLINAQFPGKLRFEAIPTLTFYRMEYEQLPYPPPHCPLMSTLGQELQQSIGNLRI